MLGLIGKKIGMTQAYDAADQVSGVTVLQLGPCPVVQVKSSDSDGYSALRVGYGQVAQNKLTRPKAGVFKKVAATPHRALREFRLHDVSSYEIGQVLDVSMFEAGEVVDVTGRTKGKGFQGTVRRHNFKGGPKTHGQSDRWRAPGSIGHSSDPSRVFKGRKMAGHMGDRQQTTKGLQVVAVDVERNLLVVKGAVPGAKGGTVIVHKKKTPAS